MVLCPAILNKCKHGNKQRSLTAKSKFYYNFGEVEHHFNSVASKAAL